MGSWDNHPNAKEFSRAERISMGLAGFGKEKRTRQALDAHAYADEVGSLRSARGGSTPAPAKREKLSWSEKRAADRVLREGKPKKGGTK